jgi:Bacterial regulatory protein, Fis family
MTHKSRYSLAQVIAAIEKSAGIKSEAARRLGCSRSMILYYLRRWPEAAEAYEQSRQKVLDMAESRLIARVERDEWPAVRFILMTLGQDRGFGQRMLISPAADADDGLADLQAALDKVYGAHD